MTTASPPSSSSLSPFLRGSLSGIFVSSLLQPFDVIKTVQQGHQGSLPVLRAMQQVIEKDGKRGLWLRGLAPTLVRGALGPGTYFQAIELTNGWFTEKNKFWDFFQGATARGLGCIVVSPFSVLKARHEFNPKSSTTSFFPLFSGVRDMFVGLGPTLARDLPFSGIYVVFYRWFQTRNTSGFWMNDLLAGLMAGVISTAATHPFDVVKTRAQIVDVVGPGTPLKMSWRDLFSGLSLRLWKRPLSTALTWACYEGLSRRSVPQSVDK